MAEVACMVLISPDGVQVAYPQNMPRDFYVKVGAQVLRAMERMGATVQEMLEAEIALGKELTDQPAPMVIQ